MTTALTHRPTLLRLTMVELRKLTDTRAGFWLLILIAVTAVAMAAVLFFAGDQGERSFYGFFGLTLIPSTVLLPVLGILSVTGEWSQRTALTTFALVPLWHRVATAKVAAVVLAALGTVLVCLAAASAATLAADLFRNDGRWTFELWTLGHAVLILLINVLMGVGFGMVLLNSPVAIVSYLVLPTAWSVLGELVSGLRRAAQWLDIGSTMEPLMTTELSQGQWARLGVSVLVWVFLPLAAGLFRLERREVA
jgi:ABC-2 type transport system permease protein